MYKSASFIINKKTHNVPLASLLCGGASLHPTVGGLVFAPTSLSQLIASNPPPSPAVVRVPFHQRLSPVRTAVTTAAGTRHSPLPTAQQCVFKCH